MKVRHDSLHWLVHRTEIKQHVRACEVIAQLDGILAHVGAKLPIPVSAKQQYSVENLMF
jgi:hypothetical protein